MTRKSLLLVVVFAGLILIGCNSNPSRQNEENIEANEAASMQEETKASKNQTETSNSQSGFWEKLEMRPFKDNRGVLLAEMPMPPSWKNYRKQTEGDPTFIGPNGLKVTDFKGRSFTYTSDPILQQSYYSSGLSLRYFPGLEQVVEQDVKPLCNAEGLKFIRYYPLPDVTKVDKWYSDQLYKAMPTETDVYAIGIDLEKKDGEPYFMLMRMTVFAGENFQSWYYNFTTLEADNNYFDQAKKQLLFALENTRYALEPIMEYNRMEAEKAGRSWAAHNQRMAQNQANFEAQQRAHINRSNAVNDAIMSGWRARNASTDRSHEQFIDAITERTNVVNAETGKQYKVDAGYNNYWMNSNGEFISTQLHDYNPNHDENMNNVNWQKLKEVRR